jgi:GT2 family glycosyltransferase
VRNRTPESRAGFIDFYGRCSIGWVLGGWIRSDFDGSSGALEVALHFNEQIINGPANMVLFRRPDVENIGRGYIVVLAVKPVTVNELVEVTLKAPEGDFTLHPSNPVERLDDSALMYRTRSILESGVMAGNKGRLLGVLSRSPYVGEETMSRLKWPVFFEIDETFFAPPSGIVLRGWFLDPFDTVETIRVRSSMGVQPLDQQKWIPIRRPDVVQAVGTLHGISDENCGFLTYVPDIFEPEDTIYIEVETTEGELGFKNVPKPNRQGITAINAILAEVHLRYGDLTKGFDEVIGPAVTAINARRLLARPHVTTLLFGPQPETPRSSVIIPLYGRIDWMEYQLAFATDWVTSEDEILYVLDDPRHTQKAEELAQSCFARFDVPFRLLLLDKNMGYAPANNVGIASARGQYLCLLNSDIIPKEPRWLEFMLDTLRGDRTVGLVGALLLFEDGSIQHAGCELVPLPEFDNWNFPLHTRKGYKPDTEELVTTVDMVSAACMVARRDLLVRLGGLSERYVIGDFEDADLCFSVRTEGLKCVVDRRAVLYHLERQSQSEANVPWRMNLTLFNAWQYRRRRLAETEGKPT